jgi:endonuclease YncB( thermonuclease family)
MVLQAVVVTVGASAPASARAKADPRRLVGTVFFATVTSVVDGDTVHASLADGSTLTIRLEGIDCPETGEPFSLRARNATRVMLFTKRAQFRATDVDRYSRLVARVSVDGVDSSMALVRRGLACHFTKYSSDGMLAAAQQQAQHQGLGFWAAGAQKPSCAVRTFRGALRPSGPFHGNTLSRVFHAPGCKNYRCRNCTVVFTSRTEADAAGFKPAGDCLK